MGGYEYDTRDSALACRRSASHGWSGTARVCPSNPLLSFVFSPHHHRLPRCVVSCSEVERVRASERARRPTAELRRGAFTRRRHSRGKVELTSGFRRFSSNCTITIISCLCSFSRCPSFMRAVFFALSIDASTHVNQGLEIT